MKKLMIATAAFAALMAAPAYAGSHISIGLFAPAPVYPAPIYYAPPPVYYAPPVAYYQPAPRVRYEPWGGYRPYAYGDDRRGWDHHRGGPHWDAPRAYGYGYYR